MVVSLMMGRVKVGDYIICDGTRGTSEQHQLYIDHARSYRRFGDCLPERTALLEELQEHDPKPWL